MNREELKEHLFSTSSWLYCILDGASIPLLPQKLFEMQATNYCLFAGEREPDMLYVAPYLVHLPENERITDWVLSECFGNHWGIFARSKRSMNGMRQHFRSMIKVYDEDGNGMLFRYYDPRVIRRYLPTCNEAELKAFFGDVEVFFAENEENGEFLKFTHEGDALKQKALN